MAAQTITDPPPCFTRVRRQLRLSAWEGVLHTLNQLEVGNNVYNRSDDGNTSMIILSLDFLSIVFMLTWFAKLIFSSEVNLAAAILLCICHLISNCLHAVDRIFFFFTERTICAHDFRYCISRYIK